MDEQHIDEPDHDELFAEEPTPPLPESRAERTVNRVLGCFPSWMLVVLAIVAAWAWRRSA